MLINSSKEIQVHISIEIQKEMQIELQHNAIDQIQNGEVVRRESVLHNQGGRATCYQIQIQT